MKISKLMAVTQYYGRLVQSFWNQIITNWDNPGNPDWDQWGE